jgi:hypothetical protein
MAIKGRHRSPEPPGPAQPYLDWAVATRFTYLRDGDWLPVLVEFNKDEPHIRIGISSGQTPLQAFADLKWLSEDKETLKHTIRIPELFSGSIGILKGAKQFVYCVVFLHRKVAPGLLASAEWGQTILRAELGPPVTLGEL